MAGEVTSVPVSGIAGFDAARNVAVFYLIADGKTLVSHTLFFVKAKDLQLPSPSIDARIDKSGKSYLITLQSKSLARAVEVTFPGIDATLSDNYIDLLPNAPETIRVESSATLSQLQAALKLTSLASAVRKPQ